MGVERRPREEVCCGLWGCGVSCLCGGAGVSQAEKILRERYSRVVPASSFPTMRQLLDFDILREINERGIQHVNKDTAYRLLPSIITSCPSTWLAVSRRGCIHAVYVQIYTCRPLSVHICLCFQRDIVSTGEGGNVFCRFAFFPHSTKRDMGMHQCRRTVSPHRSFYLSTFLYLSIYLSITIYISEFFSTRVCLLKASLTNWTGLHVQNPFALRLCNSEDSILRSSLPLSLSRPPLQSSSCVLAR